MQQMIIDISVGDSHCLALTRNCAVSKIYISFLIIYFESIVFSMFFLIEDLILLYLHNKENKYDNK